MLELSSEEGGQGWSLVGVSPSRVEVCVGVGRLNYSKKRRRVNWLRVVVGRWGVYFEAL